MEKRILLIIIPFITFVSLGTLQAQQSTISGTVVDGRTLETLPGVNVSIIDGTGGASTNANGEYVLTVPAGADSLQFSFIGYETLRVSINGRTEINVSLQQSVMQLGDELVVTAFGIEQSVKSLGYSTQNVSGDDISATQQSDIISAMQGTIAGVQIQKSGGAAGAGTSIIIRGINSLNPSADNQPLFIVDGVPVSNSTQTSNVLPSAGSNALNSEMQFSFTNRGADINPDDIESINILKGPGAAALYGLRAANGVVVITTKKGSAGPATVNFKTSVGLSQVNKHPELQDLYREGFNGRLRYNSDGSPLRFQQFGPPRTENDPFFNNYKNFFRTGQDINTYISVSGGNDKTTYFTSVSRNDEQGIVPTSFYNRTTAMLRGSTKVNDRLNVTGSVQFSNSGGNRPIGGDKSVMSNLSYQSSTFDINEYMDADGNPIDYSDGIIDNARYQVEVMKFKDDVNRVIGNTGFNYAFSEWISLDYKFGIDYYSDKRSLIVPPGLDISSQVNGYIANSNSDYSELNSNLILTGNHTFSDDFSATLKVGNTINQRRNSMNYIRGEGYSLAEFNDLSNTVNYFPSENRGLERLVGAFADAQLNYKHMLYLTLTARNDWSSTLPKNNRSFFYPSASLSYIFTESLNLDNSILEFGNIRLSWAKVGKDASPYQIGRYYNVASGFPFGGVNGFEVSSVAGSENLKPEQTTSVELGTNIRFFDNRLELDAAVYQNLSSNQIFEIPVTNTSGLSRLIANAGEIENKGIELLLRGTPVQTKDFSWDISLNWSTSRGYVKTMPEGIEEIAFLSDRITSKLVVGGDVGDLYGYDYYRASQEPGARCVGNGEICIGDNGFPTLNFDEQIKVGNAFPEWQGGITNNFNYKNIGFSFLIDIRQGGDVFDTAMRNAVRNGIDGRTSLRYQQVIFKGVTSSGAANTKPVTIDENFYRSEAQYNGAHQVILQDASWVRLRNASLSYNLPTSVINRFSMKNAKLSVTGHNLLLFTPFEGFDPEAQQFGSGSNVFGYTGQVIPPTRSVTFSINLSF